MKKSKLPKTDSVQKLAEFWDSHDLTDFEDDLEEVAEPVFVRGSSIKVHLESNQVDAIEQLGRGEGSLQRRASPRVGTAETGRYGNGSRRTNR